MSLCNNQQLLLQREKKDIKLFTTNDDNDNDNDNDNGNGSSCSGNGNGNDNDNDNNNSKVFYYISKLVRAL